jgi:serine/threonine-protein kinase
MLIETAHELVETIRELELVETDRLAGLSVLAERCESSRELAVQLIRQEWLTAFQLNQLLQGRGPALRMGPYILMERIGSGGMGQVFKAEHCRLRRMAAVKILRPEKLARNSTLPRFLREAESAAKLSHPNIVAVYDFGAVGETHYLAMEFIEGVDLARLVDDTGPLPVSLACDFIRQAALGLHHAHEQGFVHRDIKPQNLLVAPRGSRRGSQPLRVEGYAGSTVKILDMGLIRPQGENNELALTHLGVVIGTLDYIAPEQAINAHAVDCRADLYSLGCTFYHLLAGRVPFPDGQPLDKLLYHQTDYPTSIGELRSDVPEEVEDVLLAMLAKNPRERMQTAADAAISLSRFSGHVSRVSLPVADVPAEPERNVFAELEQPEVVTTADKTGQKPARPIISPSRIVRARSIAPKMANLWWSACAMALRLPVNAYRMLMNATNGGTAKSREAPQG